MNRIAQLTAALSVLFCTISCNEKIAVDFQDTPNNITITSEVGPHVKAGYEGTSSLPSDFYIDITQGAKVIYQNKVSKVTNSNKYKFVTAPEELESSAINSVYVKAITANVQQGSNTVAIAVQTDQTTDSAVKSSDLLAASTDNGIVINENNINVTFSHVLTKLVIKYDGSLGISSMSLKNVCTTGQYDYAKMEYVYPSTPSLSNISMFHNSSAKTFEAIFCPHVPVEKENVTEGLHLSIVLNGKTLTCPIALKNSDGFMGGKCYTVNVTISGTSAQNADVTITPWDGGTSNQVEGERVLWIGTSIPSGAPQYGYVSYPEYVDEAMNCTIVNNAVASSYVIPRKPESWLTPLHYLLYEDKNGAFEQTIFIAGAALGQTHNDIDTYYVPWLREISKYKETIKDKDGNVIGVDANSYSTPDEAWVQEVAAEFKKYSYDSLIRPYVDGTIDNCTTVILDHGFNDRINMYVEAGAYILSGLDIPQNVRGHQFLQQLSTGKSTFEEFKNYVNAATASDPNIYLENSYIYKMSQIIQEIQEDYPWVRIIIGNYFTVNNPYCRVVDAVLASWEDYDRLPSLICYNNQALAGLWNLDIVNVQNYLWIGDNEYWAGWDSAKGEPIEDWTKFCPDGVHPFNPESAKKIADIYVRHLDGVVGSRIK